MCELNSNKSQSIHQITFAHIPPPHHQIVLVIIKLTENAKQFFPVFFWLTAKKGHTGQFLQTKQISLLQLLSELPIAIGADGAKHLLKS